MLTCTFENGNQTKDLRHVTVEMIVLKDGQILLVKRSQKLSEGGKWALPGGYMGRDETTRQGAERETFEETGYRVKNSTLLRIVDRPDRPKEDRQNVSFVYFSEAGGKEGESDWESDEVKWFKLGDLPPKDQIAFDHFEAIECYLKYQQEKFLLPMTGE